jgi:hypothetical protein
VRQNFEQVTLAQPYDVLLYKNPISSPAHVGMVLVTQEGYQLLHHPFRGLSQISPRLNWDNVHRKAKLNYQ